MCDTTGTDPFTAETRLCDDDRMVRRGAMHHGTDYMCTGHAHFAGEHIRCTNPAHYPPSLVYTFTRSSPDPGLNPCLPMTAGQPTWHSFLIAASSG